METTSTPSLIRMMLKIGLLFMLSILLRFQSLASPTMVQAVPQNITFSGLNDSLDVGGQYTVREYHFDFSYLPMGEQVLDVDVRISLTHTWTQDVHIFLVSPSGLEIPVFEVQGCIGQFPINTIYDDEGLASGLCSELETEPRIQPLNNPGIPGPYLSTFDGLNASGIWTLRIEDQVAEDGGVIFEVGIEIVVDIPPIAGSILSPRERAENAIIHKLDEPMLEERNAFPTAPFILYQNEPNPFDGTTVINYDLLEAQLITLTVFDITGRILLTTQQESGKGRNSFRIQANEINATGVLYYRLESNGHSATKKMLMVE